DPPEPVDRAVITHGHSDHARPGHRRVLATPETALILRARLGDESFGSLEALELGHELRIGDVKVRFLPAGHVLGSAQVVLEHAGLRIVVSGDYKRRRDPTCAAFEPCPCDVFVTEATFGLPVFRHPPDTTEIARVLHARDENPERSILIGVY